MRLPNTMTPDEEDAFNKHLNERDRRVIEIPIRDIAFGHSPYSNNPAVPVSFSKYMRWNRNVGDKLAVYTDACIDQSPAGGIIWLIEPREHNQARYKLVDASGRFRAIWTHDQQLLDCHPAARLVPCCGCWIHPDDRRIWPKTKNISMIASQKTGPAGYDLRQEAVKQFGTLIDAVYGSCLGPAFYIENKIEALKDYRFSVAFENCRSNYYFTEKLIDCFATGTVPIHWGCPEIGRFFNLDGIIQIDGLESLRKVLPMCNAERYSAMAKAVADNFERAKGYYLAEDWIVENAIELFSPLT